MFDVPNWCGKNSVQGEIFTLERKGENFSVDFHLEILFEEAMQGSSLPSGK